MIVKRFDKLTSQPINSSSLQNPVAISLVVAIHTTEEEYARL